MLKNKVSMPVVASSGASSGGGGDDRILVINSSYAYTDILENPIAIVSPEIANNIKNGYYKTIEVRYSDNTPMATFTCNNFKKSVLSTFGIDYVSLGNQEIRSGGGVITTWYGSYSTYKDVFMRLKVNNVSIYLDNENYLYTNFNIDKSKFDKLYKLSDAPTEDGTYTLKCSVSNGVASYSWVKDA